MALIWKEEQEKRKQDKRRRNRVSDREQTTIRLPAGLKEKLQQEAERRGISFNAYVLLLIDKGRQHLHQ